MKNNQLNGNEHADGLKQIIKNHPSLTKIDFSNSEMNVNKNKLKNIGVEAIIEGILETENQSIISDINLSYNFLSQECLPFFAKLSNPEFVQIQSLNLSYNDLGQDCIKTLTPILPSIMELSLANTRLTNQSMYDLAHLFTLEEMSLRHLDIHNNLITSEGFYTLMF